MNYRQKAVIEKIGFLPKKVRDNYVVQNCNVNGWRKLGIRNDMIFKSFLGKNITSSSQESLLNALYDASEEELRSCKFEATMLSVYNHVGFCVENVGGRYAVSSVKTAVAASLNICNGKYLHRIASLNMCDYEKIDVWSMLLSLNAAQFAHMEFRWMDNGKEVSERFGFIPAKRRTEGIFTVTKSTEIARRRWNMGDGMEFVSIRNEAIAGLYMQELLKKMVEMEDAEMDELRFGVKQTETDVLSHVGFVPRRMGINLAYVVTQCSEAAAQCFNIDNGMELYAVGETSVSSLAKTDVFRMILALERRDMYQLQFRRFVNDREATVQQVMGFVPVWHTGLREFVVSRCTAKTTETLHICDGMSMIAFHGTEFRTLRKDRVLEICSQMTTTDLTAVTFGNGTWAVSPSIVYERIGFLPIKESNCKEFVVYACSEEMAQAALIWDGMEFTHIGNCAVGGWGKNKLYEKLAQATASEISSFVFRVRISPEAVLAAVGFIPIRPARKEYYVTSEMSSDAERQHNVTNGVELCLVDGEPAWKLNERQLFEKLVNYDNTGMVALVFAQAPRAAIHTEIDIMRKYGFVLTKVNGGESKYYVVTKCTEGAVSTYGVTEGKVLYRIFDTDTRKFHKDALYERMLGCEEERMVFAEQIQLDLISKYENIAQEWDYDNPCEHCGFVYMKRDHPRRGKNRCCMDGGAFSLPSFPRLQPLPQMLNAIATTKINHMTNSCTYYNNIFCLGATGVDNGKEGVGWEKGVGDRCAKICGRTYHYLPKTGGSGGVQYFTFDANNEQLLRHEETIQNLATRRMVNLQKTYLKLLYDELMLCNPLMQECEMVGSMVGHGEIMEHEEVINLKSSINVQTCMFDVAAITSNAITGDRILTYKLKGSAQGGEIPAMSSVLEPLSYPLFFPHGEFGWSEEIKNEVKYYTYMQARMLCPERDENGDILRMMNKLGTRMLSVNRFQLMARLGQHYAVDMISRNIDHRLLYQKHNQSRITRGHITDRDGPQTEDGPTYLHQSQHGSRRHLREKARDALSVVSEYGKPTWFITLTCNPMWPEIQEQLLPGQSAFDRPDIVTRVFKQRLGAFMTNLRAGKYFDDFEVAVDGTRIPVLHRSVIYEMYVIEYQQRGMPHAHIVVKLEQVPDFNVDDATTAKWIDERLTAVLPDETDAEYYDLVSTHLIHNCSSSCSKDGICKYGFHANCIQMCTTFDDKGFPHYRRVKETDLRVVPHTRETVLDWRGHVFIEFAGSSRCTLYLYKYLYKGSKKVRMELTNIEGVHEDDEITMHLRGRYLCSMDAMWRILGYNTYPASKPVVNCISVIMPQDVEFNRHHNEVTDMLVYFSRPDCLADLTYSELFQKYTRNFTRPNSMTEDDEGILYYELQFDGIDRPVFLIKRADPRTALVRLAMRYPMNGEVFYLRVILLRRPCTSFVDALTFGEHICSTFQDSAIKHGYVDDVKEASICFDEACQFKLPRELRSLFAFMTVQGFPTHHLFFNENRFGSLTEDYIGNPNIIQSEAGFRSQFLKELHELLAENGGMDLGDYGFPVPKNLTTELERERIRYDVAAEMEKLARLNSAAPNNRDQQNVFDSVVHCLDHISESTPGTLLFLSGQGGCGKSTLAKKLMAYARAKGFIALGCASTGLAATVYEDFYTAHSLFCYPVQDEDEKDESEPARCELERNPQRAELLKEASFIVWDESLCNHKELFEAAYRATNEFLGKVVLLMGDFRQIMPVIKDATRVELLQACLTSSYLWSSFRVFALTINMRLEVLKMNLAREKAELESANNIHDSDRIIQLTERLTKQTRYGDMIISVGEGISTHSDVSILNDNTETGSQHLAMHTIAPYICDTEAALLWLYPGGFQHERLIETAILAATNELVEEWNEKVQEMNPNVVYELLSHDTLSEVDDPYGILASIISDRVLADTKVNGVPPHVLRLKVGDVCLVMRNLSKRYGLATNSRVIVQFISQYCIRVQTIGDRPVSVTIPRIRFRFKIPGGHSFEVMRTQFPLRLAYSLTMNKSQGQSLKAVLLDTRRAPFAHGHFYVALSRVLDYATIKLYCNEEDVYDGYPVVVNVVYPDLIQCI